MIKKYKINVHSLDENDGTLWSAFYFKKDADSELKRLNNNSYFTKLGYMFSLEVIPIYTVAVTRWDENDEYCFETLEHGVSIKILITRSFVIGNISKYIGKNQSL